MEYTNNYHLPQWQLSDRIMMEDFNQAMADLDAGLAAAQSGADAAQTAAAEKPYVIGSYTGSAPDSGTDAGQLIDLGFQPAFLIITRGWAGTTFISETFLAIGQMRSSGQDTVFQLKENGFLVKNPTSGGPLKLNTSGYTYDYIAFK